VRVISHKKSTLRQASGLIDVLGYRDGDLVADPFAAVDALSEGHPYERVGVEAIRDGLALFNSVTDYCGGHTDRNALVPTHGGTVKPTARYPGSVAAGLASDDRPALLVGFEGLTDFDAPLAADHLRAAGVPFDVAGATVSFPVSLRADATVTRYARLLDEDAPVDGDGSGERGRRAGGADRVRAALASASPPFSARIPRGRSGRHWSGRWAPPSSRCRWGRPLSPGCAWRPRSWRRVTTPASGWIPERPSSATRPRAAA